MTDFGPTENIQPAAPECNVSVVIPTLSERASDRQLSGQPLHRLTIQTDLGVESSRLPGKRAIGLISEKGGTDACE